MTGKVAIKWIPSIWRSFSAQQRPAWPDDGLCDEIRAELASLPALVFAGETRALKQELAEAAEGRAFVLQAGDCAEDFARCNGPRIHDLLKVILRMSIILAFAVGRKIVRVGRMAGQYAKPRSAETERVGDVDLPSYRGDMVNSPEPTSVARTPDPRRMLEGYFRSAATLNLVRAFTQGGFAALDHIRDWSHSSFGAFPTNPQYDQLVSEIQKAIQFMVALGLDPRSPQLNEVTLYTSHEALLLEYEEALTRVDTTTGDWYDTSAHMLWIGDRTRQPDGAHVEFLRGVGNPIGIKIGPGYAVDDILRAMGKLNPDNEPGRISLIPRLGAEKINALLPPLIRAVQQAGFRVAWICDPMHGNTYVNARGQKLREFDVVLREIRRFWDIHRAEGTVAAGVHLELTGDNVTECLGGSRGLADRDLNLNYQTTCDPRLNAEQAVELAFEIAQIIRPQGNDKQKRGLATENARSSKKQP